MKEIKIRPVNVALTMNFICFKCVFSIKAGQKRSDAEAEAEIETDTETEIVTKTGRGDVVLVRAPGPDLAPETASGTATEIAANDGTNLHAGVSARRAPEKTKTETGRTNMWTVLHRRSHPSGTSTTAKSPVSCSSDASFSWKD